jgi:plastocyanin
MHARHTIFQIGAVLAAMTLLPANARAEDLEIQLQIKDHQFVPAAITAPAGQKFKITVHNEGSGPAEFESVDFHREKVIPAGKDVTLHVGPLQAGEYEFFDDFHAQTRGHLTVK